MTFCGNCGTELTGSEKFCSTCGTSIRTENSSPRSTQTCDGFLAVRPVKNEDDSTEVPAEQPQKKFGLRIAAFGVFLVVVVGTCLVLSLLWGDKPSIQGGATEQQVHRLYHAKKGSGVEFLEQVAGSTADYKIVQIYREYTPSAVAAGLGSDGCTDDWYVTSDKWFILPYGKVQAPCAVIPRSYRAKKDMAKKGSDFFSREHGNSGSGSQQPAPKVLSKDPTKFHVFPNADEVATYVVGQWNSISGPGGKQNIFATSMSCFDETPYTWIPNGKLFNCTVYDRWETTIGTVRVQYGDEFGAASGDSVNMQFHTY
jgi:hypothetical protein